jgi:hypothetical protein
MNSISHFHNSLNYLLHLIAKETKYSGKVPTSKDILHEYKRFFIKKSSTNKTRKQRGGNYILQFIKNQVFSIIGISQDTGSCAYVESLLNILCWTAVIYASTVPKISTWGIGFDDNMTPNQFISALSSPADYILSHIPRMSEVLRETTMSRIITYCMNIWSDYKNFALEDSESVKDLAYFGTAILRLVKLNGATYEYVFMRPILCLVSHIYKSCETRCNKDS